MDINKIKCSLGLHKWDGGKCARLHCSKTREQFHNLQEPPEHLRRTLERVEREWAERESKLKGELLEHLELLLFAEGELERWQWLGRREEPGLGQAGQRQRELVQERERLRKRRELLRQEQEQLSRLMQHLRALKEVFREDSARELATELERMPPELKHERLQWELVQELVRLERERSEQGHVK